MSELAPAQGVERLRGMIEELEATIAAKDRELEELKHDVTRQVAITTSQAEEIAELEKDRARLEFVIGHGALVQVAGDPAHAYCLDYAAIGEYPGWLETAYHDTWRDAIDEAMAQQGDTCTEAKE